MGSGVTCARFLRFRLLRRSWLVRTIEGNRPANKRLEGGLVNLFSFVDVNRPAHLPVEARVEETGRVGERRALGEGEFHDALVGLAGAEDAVVRPHRRAHPLPFLDDIRVGLLDELGVAHTLVDAERARAIEPGLNPDTELAAALHLPQDGVGNCRQFAHLIKARAQQLGVQFRFDHHVQRIVPGPRPTVALELPRHDGDTRIEAPPPFDAIVICAGHLAASLLTPLGVHLPLAPIHGYSITAPLRQREGYSDAAPRAGLMDERYKVAITRLGQRIRVAGGAELGGRPGTYNKAALRTLYQVLEDWFPGAAVTSKAQHWKGTRPMLPDGPPVIGPSGSAGVWLNAGHGSSGWVLACGSARLVADMVTRRTSAIDAQGLALSRLQ